MNKSISIYSCFYAGGEEGEKRCIYEGILKDFKHIYDFEYLARFFEEKTQDYFSKSIESDEKFYELKRKNLNEKDVPMESYTTDNLFSALQVVWVIKSLKFLYDRGYDFEITDISSEENGWIMNFTFDFKNLTKEQIEIIYINAFEQNQFDPKRSVI